jgi:hypothetical protein
VPLGIVAAATVAINGLWDRAALVPSLAVMAALFAVHGLTAVAVAGGGGRAVRVGGALGCVAAAWLALWATDGLGWVGL